MTSPHRLSRRQFLPRAAAGLAATGAAGFVGYELHGESPARAQEAPRPQHQTTPSPADSAAGTGLVQRFVTRPDLAPPPVTITPLADGAQSTAPPYFFVAPRSYSTTPVSQDGLMIVDRQGRLIYFQPILKGQPFDFNVQTYQHAPTLSWWQGAVVNAHGQGVGELADSAYRQTATIRAGDGLQTDLHELTITAAGTALITAYGSETTDLSSAGGPKQGKVFVGHAQEIDIATGKVLFDWNSLDHVGVDESEQELPPKATGTWDYFHINSIGETDDGNLLISARNTWTLYKVDRSSGKIIWRLNGKRSDFSISSAAQFYWQHHARLHGSSVLTVFDNAGPNKAKFSRGLLLSVDERSKQVGLTQQFLHPAAFISTVLGSVQLLPDGRVVVGWGTQPYFSEFDADGTMTLAGEFPGGIRSYRAFAADWSGHPADPPSLSARSNPAGGFILHVSWNGATGVDRWTVLAGSDQAALSPIGSQPWTGFETTIAVNSTGPSFCAVAVDRNGRELGRSQVI